MEDYESFVPSRSFAKIILSLPRLFTGEKRRGGPKVDGKLVAESRQRAGNHTGMGPAELPWSQNSAGFPENHEL